MFFDAKYKPELIASKDETRDHIQHVELDVANKRMCATDGHRLIIVPCQPDDKDHSGPVTADALKAARKAHRRLPACEINANGALAVPLAPTFPRPTRSSDFPPVDKVVPTVASFETAVTFGVNARYLYEMAQALGVENIRITVDSSDLLKPILVNAGDPAIGVVMPVRI